ncbi:methylated-DNA--[protein]-cysteine S-methyltransferase [Aquabacterium sp.]|uniref:methylated-DNA--[protein]-cysteine S-methyltransferase n=1 Tax=Aquabacterium sp. TaxID=1872578 RepID=UPI0019BB3BA4|nr:methylated-DNA--[protein]-cysteine S-methyltransferase [Aquabacterium sp.]MBC7699284.1 methylated-DNA--[protein]-cysteine S-methyltransferase [Aquabacterium sp.]
MYTAQTHIDSPLGQVLLARTAQGLAGLWFAEGQRDFPGRLEAPMAPNDPLFQDVEMQLQRYWDAPQGTLAHFNIPLDLLGTAFQQSVWRALLTMAHGEICSYGDIAQRLGNPQAHRAVGMAVGRNPISIIVPCHRVVGRDTQLTGYSGGMHRKIALLTQEGHLVHDDRLHRPVPGQAMLA